MKKLLVLTAAFSLIAVNVSSANYVLYYKTSEYGQWVKGGTYSDFNSCERARQYSYQWAYASRCNSE